MRKIILSVAVAAMALSTTASALEDIKVNGQAKLWYETNDKGANNLFEGDADATGEIVFKLGVTGKQGNVGFGATIYQTTDLGLTGEALYGTRSETADSDMFLGEVYVTAPMGSMASLKLGRQELNTPYLFTETWNALPNTFDAAVVTVKPMADLSLVAMYVGADNTSDLLPTDSFKVDGADRTDIYGGALVAGALYKNSAFDANFWYTNVGNYNGVSVTPTDAGETLSAFYLDAGTKVADVALRAYATTVDGSNATESTEAYALSAGVKVGTFDLFAAASTVTDDDETKTGYAVANISTINKKSFLPTEAVYTDGLYVAQQGSTAFKLKASTKLGSTGVALQVVDNSNDTLALVKKETTEVDLFLTDKFGDFSTTAILMHRSFDQDAEDSINGGYYARFIVALNF